MTVFLHQTQSSDFNLNKKLISYCLAHSDARLWPPRQSWRPLGQLRQLCARLPLMLTVWVNCDGRFPSRKLWSIPNHTTIPIYAITTTEASTFNFITPGRGVMSIYSSLLYVLDERDWLYMLLLYSLHVLLQTFLLAHKHKTFHIKDNQLHPSDGVSWVGIWWAMFLYKEMLFLGYCFHFHVPNLHPG